MKRYTITLVVVAVILWLACITEANVVFLDYGFGRYPGECTYEWNFDYDLQQLTITEDIYAFGTDVLLYLGFHGKVDSESTFHVVRTITNNTGATWTYLEMFAGPACIGAAYPWIVPESVKSTALQVITFSNEPGDRARHKFAAPLPVLDGETFTMEFDIHIRYDEPSQGGFCGGWNQIITPEPTTLLFLGLGALVLVRRRRAQKP